MEPHWATWRKSDTWHQLFKSECGKVHNIIVIQAGNFVKVPSMCSTTQKGEFGAWAIYLYVSSMEQTTTKKGRSQQWKPATETLCQRKDLSGFGDEHCISEYCTTEMGKVGLSCSLKVCGKKTGEEQHKLKSTWSTWWVLGQTWPHSEILCQNLK